MYKFLTVVCVLAVVVLSGCASTTIVKRPDGSVAYTESKSYRMVLCPCANIIIINNLAHPVTVWGYELHPVTLNPTDEISKKIYGPHLQREATYRAVGLDAHRKRTGGIAVWSARLPHSGRGGTRDQVWIIDRLYGPYTD